MEAQQEEALIMRKILTTTAVLILLLVLTGCNKQIIDTTYHFNYAQISMPDGTVVEGEVQSWTDYSDGDQIQIKIDNVVYLTHATNVVLMQK